MDIWDDNAGQRAETFPPSHRVHLPIFVSYVEQENRQVKMSGPGNRISEQCRNRKMVKRGFNFLGVAPEACRFRMHFRKQFGNLFEAEW